MRRHRIASAMVLALTATAGAAEAPGMADGRVLASNCMQCHATRVQAKPGFDSLARMSAAEIAEEMAEMARLAPGREPEKDLMAVHARAYTRAEIDLIAKYLGTR